MQLQATYKEIWKIAYPIMLGSLAQSINQMIDTAFLGRVSIEDLGAGNLGGLFFILLVLVGLGFTKGGQILIARKAGSNDLHGIGEVFDNLLYKMAFLSIFLFAVCYWIIPELTPWMISSPGISERSVIFLKARSWGMFPTMLNITLIAFYTGIGKTRIISISTLVQAVINIILDWILIFGHFGIPAMGIKGAAYATNTAELLGLVVFIIALKRSDYPHTFQLWKWVGVKWSLMKEMLNLSLPLVVQNILGLGSWQIFFLLVEKMGDRELAISSIGKSLYMFMGIPAWGLASTVNTFVSNLVGQGNMQEVPSAIRKSIVISIVFAITFCIPIVLAPEITLSIYTNDFSLIRDCLPTLWVLLSALILFSTGIILIQSIMGMGNTRISMAIELTCIAFYMLHVYITTQVIISPLYVVWMSEWTYWLTMTVLCLIYFRSKRLTFQPKL